MKSTVAVLLFVLSTVHAESVHILESPWIQEQKHLLKLPDEIKNHLSRSINWEKLPECYAKELGGKTFNIFNASLNVEHVSKFYYGVFSSKEPTKKSILNLWESAKQILTSCLKDDNQGVKFGFTHLSDMSEEEFANHQGFNPDRFWNLSDDRLTFDAGARLALTGQDETCKASNENVPKEWNWIEQGKVTPVRQQGNCGSCWAFATTASMESAVLIKQNKTLDLSEQQIVDCALRHGCEGGISYVAFGLIAQKGQTTEESWPYRAADDHCHETQAPVVKIRNYCIRTVFDYGRDNHIEKLTEEKITAAIYKFGPVYSILATGREFQNYRGGVFPASRCSSRIDHAITIVGYTPEYWIIKNSWGSSWGHGGMLHLQRGQNACQINTEIAYPILA